MARALAGLLLSFVALACQPRETKLDRYGALPTFTLQNQQGKPFSDSDLRGRVVVVDFIFTSCPDVCPMLTEQLAALRKQLPVDAPLSFVSFSVDPEHDTPERLHSFAKAHGVDVDHFWFLTGPITDVTRVVKQGFKQAMEAVPAREGQPRNVLHGTHFVLIDQHGEIRGFFANDADGHVALKTAVSTLLSKGPDA
jgi:protein SCO1